MMIDNNNVNIDDKPVLAYYCKCGKSIESAGDPEYIKRNRALKKDYRDAEKWGRKVETITLAKFREIPFMCKGVPDCPDFGNQVSLAKTITDEAYEKAVKSSHELFLSESRQEFFNLSNGNYD